jgi:hypothetical protein
MFMSTQKEILNRLRGHLLAGDPRLAGERLTADASLTRDLHVDSTRLAELAAFARREIADVDLTPWYLEVTRTGGDTLGTLAAFLAGRPAATAAAAGPGVEP